MAQVTSAAFAERLLRSARQAAEIETGTATAARTSRHELATRNEVVREPPPPDVMDFSRS